MRLPTRQDGVENREKVYCDNAEIIIIVNFSPGHNNTPFTARPLSLKFLMLRRKQLLQDKCFRKPQNPLYIEEADFSRFIVIEKLRFVFRFIPKVSCATGKRVLYAAENMGKATGFNPHRRILFKWLSDHTPSKRKLEKKF